MPPSVVVNEEPNPWSAFASDQVLLRGCRNGEEAAWLQLLDKYERLVYSIPRSYGLSAEDAADIVQIVFIFFIQNLPTLRENSELGGWLTLVARRHTWRVLQRRRREVVTALDEESLNALLPGHNREIERWELIEWLHRSLALIGERCRRLLMALYFEEDEPSYTQVAQRLDLPVGSIGPTRARCLQRLQEMLTR